MRALVFGSTGAIGRSIIETFEGKKWETIGVSRHASKENELRLDDNFDDNLAKFGPYDAIIFAQGKNTNDSIINATELLELLEVNVVFISSMIEKLHRTSSLQPTARVTIIGSIWQDVSRVNKFSYSVSKSALQGLINSMVADLSPSGISVNIVAPGVVDTPMTRNNLTDIQIQRIITETPTGKLVKTGEVASLVYWLRTPFANGINGQTIKIDNGWSNVRII